LGVEVRENTMVTGISAESVEASGWRIPSRTVVWAAGNQASPLLTSLGVPLTPQGRAVVEADCTVPGHPELFVLGDAAWHDHDVGPVPATCPAAIQMGQYAAKAIRKTVSGEERGVFRFWDKGELAVIGRGHAVADIGRLHFGGFLAWLAWALIHIAYLIGFRNRVLVMLQWAWSYLTFGRGARLITGETGEYAARVAPK
jgi:NADH dehydrogenase